MRQPCRKRRREQRQAKRRGAFKVLRILAGSVACLTLTGCTFTAEYVSPNTGISYGLSHEFKTIKPLR